jgi:radical SAM protein with 4Fe4S-binding SPASM domain
VSGLRFSLVAPELTNRCNYLCPHCPHAQLRRPVGDMPLDLFAKIFEECQKQADELVFGFFGEPLLYPKFFELMDFVRCHRGRLRISMNTNLSRATREHFRALIDARIDDVRLSVDAATPLTYQRVRPGSSCVDLDGDDLSGSPLDAIDEKIRYWHALPGHCPTRHVFTVTSRNRDDLRGYVRTWLPRLGPGDRILAKRVLSYGGKIRDELIEPFPCAIWDDTILAIDWSGRVSPCNLDTDLAMCVGDVTRQTLDDICRGPARSEARRTSESRREAPCRDCVDGNAWAPDRAIEIRAGDDWERRCGELFDGA